MTEPSPASDQPPGSPPQTPGAPTPASATSAVPPVALATVSRRRLDALLTLRACGDSLRFRILKLLLEGPPASAAELTGALRADRTTISKALHLLHDRDILVRAEGLTRDGRHSRFMIDPAWRDPTDPAALDFGTVRLHFR